MLETAREMERRVVEARRNGLPGPSLVPGQVWMEPVYEPMPAGVRKKLTLMVYLASPLALLEPGPEATRENGGS